MKRIVLIIVFLLYGVSATLVWGQGEYESVKLTSQTSTNITGGQLVKTGSTDLVDLSTGRINYSFPVFDINVKDLKIPVSLKYSTNGHKVSTVSSCIGLGWDLIAGGKITRVVKGLRDDYKFDGYICNAGDSLNKYLFDGSVPPVPVPYDPNTPSGWAFLQELTILQETCGNAADNAYDGEPDIYSFSFGKYSGSFIFDKDGAIHLIPQQNLAINYITAEMHGSISNDIVSFEITDYENGILFTFGNTAESREEVLEEYVTPLPRLEWDWVYGTNNNISNKYLLGGNPVVNNDGHYTSWYLTKVEFFNNDEEITIDYEKDSIWSYVGTDESIAANSYLQGFLDDKPFVVSRFNKALYMITPLIKSIDWNSGTISFIESENYREDINDRSATMTPGRLKGHTIDRIEVYRKYVNSSSGTVENELLKTVDLKQRYLYHNFGTESQDHPSYYTRLILDTIVSNDELYTFDYLYGENKDASPQYFISRNTPQVDHWGYLKYNSDRKVVKPKVYFYLNDRSNAVYHSVYSIWPRSSYVGDEIELEGNDMEPDLESIKLGLLNKVHLPTGGTIEFEYELNDFLLDTYVRNGPGVRVKTVTLSDPGVSDGNIQLSYSYEENGTTSGRITSIPDPAKQDLNAVAHGYCNNYVGDDAMFYATRTDRSFSTMIDLFGSNESTVHYSKVTVDYHGAGKKEYFYENLFTAEDNSVTIDNYTIEKTNTVRTDWYDCPDLPNAPSSLSGSLYIDATPHFTFPLTDWFNYYLKKEVTYDEEDKLVEATEYIYSVEKDDNTEVPYVQGRYHNRILEIWHIYDNHNLNLYPLDNDFVFSQYDMLWGVNKYVSGYLKLDEVINTKYNNGNENEAFVTTTNYNYYVNDYYSNFVSDKTVTNSDLKEHTDFFLYTFNYPLTSIIEKMLHDCYVIKLIETYSKADQLVNQGIYNNYVSHGSYVVLSDVLKLGISEPTADFTPSNNATSYDSKYVEDKAFKYYDSNGIKKTQIIESQKDESYPIAYIWGFPNYSNLIAIVENATYSDVTSELSTMGYTVDDLQDKSDSELIAIFQTLRQRSNMANALITSYTYKPLVGMTSETNPAGLTTFYEYDSFGRLKYSKNHQGEYLQKFDYHYKTQ